ncbi:bifunctional 2-polyprenyl-6-hydroxyphenol methylase/3-demethylubiquinol 3-O-methyltransferase UbiG [Aquisalinus flavus]|uniref:bifunctional 2-polyprenyl-6-hydroxyphenol methylase/3-demethylubiquinol 3-O-methyltransferase UbiG n=1 Tax=Aquisalinus flavus TaxID=1526572 RepID=UPI0035716390
MEKFSAMAADWWDPSGKFKPLHKFNPVRLTHIRNEICAHFGRDPNAKRPLEGLRLLDIGCGGGLVSEPMARLGAQVTGIDAAARNVKTALTHAAEQGVTVDYRATTAEELLASGIEPFDAVLNLEVVEHVADVDLFLRTSADLVRPGGIMFVATINRTLKAFATAKFAAEYILRWLPVGTHDQNKFVKPEEARHALERAGMQVDTPVGMSYQPLSDAWRVTGDASVNYMLTATKPALT